MVLYKLIYFNAMGRAEMARILFAQAGVKYEDVRITQEEWAQMKEGTPFGQIPVLEIDGEQLCQSSAIVGFLAREFKLAGKDNREQARVEMVNYCFQDMMLKFPFAEKDEKKKGEAVKELLTNVFPGMLKKIEALLVKNGGGDGFFVSELSSADIAWMMVAHFLQSLNPEILSSTPKIAALAKRIASLPKITEWLKTRPKTEF